MVEVTTWIALALILGGMLLIFLEIMNPGLFIAVVGTVMVVLGLLVWIVGTSVFEPWGAVLTVGIAIVASWITLAAYRRWAPPSDRPVTMSKDSLPGMEGRVEQAIFAGERGEVRVAGQRWHATADADLPPGTRVRIRDVDGLTLIVDAVPTTSSKEPAAPAEASASDPASHA